MNLELVVVMLAVVAVMVSVAMAEGGLGRIFPGESWQFKQAGEVGVEEARLQKFIDALSRPDAAGCVVRNGYMVKLWGDPQEKVGWMSASKPVLTTLLFHAIQQGKLKGVDDLVGDWGWDLKPKDRTMTFGHLANMISGYACDEAPGAAWGYNDFGIKLYQLTLERVFGKHLNEVAAECFAALQFQDGPDIFAPNYHYRTSPRDFARIGWLWMNRGNWNGRQVLPKAMFDEYMKPYVPGDLPWTQTPKAIDYLGIGSYGGGHDQKRYNGLGVYGFCWWFNSKAGTSNISAWPDAPADTFLGIGWGGVYIAMIPSKGLLAAARGNWGHVEPGNVQSPLNANLKLLADCATK
jgi:CubicO group peptidase (beta-lactamase class C family)